MKRSWILNSFIYFFFFVHNLNKTRQNEVANKSIQHEITQFDDILRVCVCVYRRLVDLIGVFLGSTKNTNWQSLTTANYSPQIIITAIHIFRILIFLLVWCFFYAETKKKISNDKIQVHANHNSHTSPKTIL